MDDFMQWAMNSLDQQQQHHQHHAVAPHAYGGIGSGDGDGGGISAGAAAVFPSLQALRCQSNAAGGGFRDLTVQVDQHRASSWSASSCDSPGVPAMDHDATAAAAAAAAGWSLHTARARSSRPMSWNFGAASASTQLTDASQLVSPAAASAAAAAGRGGQCTPTAGRRGSPLAATVSHGQGGGGTAASSSASAGGPVQDHIMAERRRREKINQRFIELSTVIPGLKKMDKATILGDAVKYVRELQEKVKTLEDDDSAAAPTIRSAVLVNKKKPCLGLAGGDTNAGETSTGGAGGLPEIEVRVSDEKSVLLRIHCENAKGLLVRVLAEVEALRLAITHTSVMPFPAATAIITITAKVEDGFNSTVEEIVRKLNSVLHQHYRASLDQNTPKREC